MTYETYVDDKGVLAHWFKVSISSLDVSGKKEYNWLFTSYYA